MSWARARQSTAGLTVPQARHGPSKLNRAVPGQESRHDVLARHSPCRAWARWNRAGPARHPKWTCIDPTSMHLRAADRMHARFVVMLLHAFDRREREMGRPMAASLVGSNPTHHANSVSMKGAHRHHQSVLLRKLAELLLSSQAGGPIYSLRLKINVFLKPNTETNVWCEITKILLIFCEKSPNIVLSFL